MATNGGFYQQGPGQQQQTGFQQPQNIYQQLGKPQPQPHLQGYAQQPMQSSGFQFAQQPQQQQVAYAQSQTPYLPSQTTYQAQYQAPQTPYQPVQPPYHQGQYLPPFGAQVQPQAQFQLTQSPYNPSPSPYIQQQQQLVQYQQQPPQAQTQLLPASSFPTHTQPQYAAIDSGPGSSWRISPKPPPVALSASLAQQIPGPSQAQISALQRQQSQPPSPQHQTQPQPQPQNPNPPPQLQGQTTQSHTPSAARRPLPQPSPGTQTGHSLPAPPRSQTLPPTSSGINGPNAMSPAVANAIAQLQKQTPQPLSQQGQARPSTTSPATGSPLPPGAAAPKAFPRVQPQPIVTGSGIQASSSGSPSPTRGRPLPTPTRGETSSPTAANAKRMTVDMGRLPHGSSAIVPSLGGGRTSPTKTPSAFERKSLDTPSSKTAPAGLSRTSSYAIGAAPSSLAPNRRSSPPRFQAQSRAANASPTKGNGVATVWGANVLRAVGVGPPETGNEAGTAQESSANAIAVASGSGHTHQTSTAPLLSTSNPNPQPTAVQSSAAPPASSPTNSGIPPAKKFTPMWRRTIPEMPAPAWGYAAGMVSEPHPKPRAVPVVAPPAPPPVLTPKEQKKKEKEEKEQRKKEEKERKKREKEEAKAAANAAKLKKGKMGSLSPGASARGPAPALSAGQAGHGHGHGQQVSAQARQQQQMALVAQQQQYRQQAVMQQQQQRQQPQLAQYGHARAPASYRQPQTETEYETDEDEDEDEDEEEEDEEEEEEEEEEESEEESEEQEEDEEDEREDQRQGRRYISSSREYTQPLRSSSQPRFEGRETARNIGYQSPSSKKRGSGATALRPKSAVDTSPIGANTSRWHTGTEREHDTEYPEYPYPHARDRPSRAARQQPAPKTKLIPSPIAKLKVRPKRDDEREHAPASVKKRVVPRSESVGHVRSRSAFAQREEVVRHRREASEFEARARRRPGSAFAGSASDSRRRLYEDEEDDGDSIRLAYDDDEEEEEDDNEDDRWEGTPLRRPMAGPSTNGRLRQPAQADRYQYDDDEREDTPRRRPATASAERQRDAGLPRNWDKRDQDEDSRYRSGSTGLPQPPALSHHDITGGGPSARGSPEKPVRGGQRMSSAPLKYDNEDDTRYQTRGAQQDMNTTHAKFTAMNVNKVDTRVQTHGRSQSSAGGWPVDLPRLPRTPGTGNTPGATGNEAAGYFDSKPYSAAPGSNFTRSRSNTNPSVSFPLPPALVINSNSESAFHKRPPPQTPSRANLNLDDPPPRASIVRTPSPGPQGGYVLTPRRELPQPQGAPQDRGHAAEDTARVNADLARRRSLYSAASNSTQRQPDVGSPQRRPQSHMYGNFDQAQPQQHQHQQFHQQQAPHQQQQHQNPHFSSHLGGNQEPPTNMRPQQTPAPPPTVGIESPHPIGGREKMADIPKLEEDSNDGSDNEHRRMPRRALPNHGPVPMIQVDAVPHPPSNPMISVNGSPVMNNTNIPMINIDSGNGSSPRKQVFEIPGVSVSAPQFDDHHGGPSFSITGPDDHSHSNAHHGHGHGQQQQQQQQQAQSQFAPHRTGGLICGGCHGAIIGRIVSAMGQRFHPSCFKCTVCDELLEHVSSYEHEGRPYCHLDYHENFAPRCYSCKTAIIEEQFISLDDPALGKRAYHTQHFFCSECGDPFLTPSGGLPTNSNGEMAVTGDGEFEGFTVYKGYPYCEACHVRLRLPKCKRCKRSIRDNDEAVEALGGKWCWKCFVCANCEKPFEDPSFFQRGDQPYCEHCFSIILRNEI